MTPVWPISLFHPSQHTLASGSGTGTDLRQPMRVAQGILLELWEEVLSSCRGAELKSGLPGAAGDHPAPPTEIKTTERPK